MKDEYPKFTKGVPIQVDHSTDKMNRLSELDKRNTIVSVIGGRIVQGDGGGILIIDENLNRGGSSVLTPFLIAKKTDTTITVSYGQVNNITPTIGGNRLDNNNPPQLTLSTAGINHIYLNCSLDDGGDITAIVISSGLTIPSQTASNAYKNIGDVTVDSTPKITGSPNQSVTNSLDFQRCGTNNLFWAI